MTDTRAPSALERAARARWMASTNGGYVTINGQSYHSWDGLPPQEKASEMDAMRAALGTLIDALLTEGQKEPGQ